MKNIILFYSVISILSGNAFAESSLQLKPAKCVTLKQGNTCYQEIEIIWQGETKGDYCLFEADNLKPLKCWDNDNASHYKFEFSGAQSVYYKLLKMPSKTLVAQQYFSVKWVYKIRPNHRWRLF